MGIEGGNEPTKDRLDRKAPSTTALAISSDVFRPELDQTEQPSLDPVLFGYFHNELGPSEVAKRLAYLPEQDLVQMRAWIRAGKVRDIIYRMEGAGRDLRRQLALQAPQPTMGRPATLAEVNAKAIAFAEETLSYIESLEGKYDKKS